VPVQMFIVWGHPVCAFWSWAQLEAQRQHRGWQTGRHVVLQESRNTLRTACLSTTSSTTNPTQSDLASNCVLRGQRTAPVTHQAVSKLTHARFLPWCSPYIMHD
jgi:hypothetical protein